MKTIIKLTKLTMTAIIIYIAASITAFASSPIDVVIGENKIDFRTPRNGASIGSPIIENGRTYVPIRVISENLGYNVDWEQRTQTVIIKKDEDIVEIKINETKALVNGVSVNIDLNSNNTKSLIKNSRVYVPIRFIAEVMGEQVDYKKSNINAVSNATIYINSNSSLIDLDKQPDKPNKELYTEISEYVVKERIIDIENKWAKLKPTVNDVKYTIIPNANSPYVLGGLTNETLNNALNTTNFIRYVAYLSSNVILDNEFNREAQAASISMAANNQLSHSPKKSTGMSDKLYELSKLGARSSNISAGYDNIIDSIIEGYMNDGGPTNISKVGHRLWILSPELKKVGFGFIDKGQESNPNFSYSAMKVIESGAWFQPYESYDFISWPARIAMPIQQFTGKQDDFPWSVSLNKDKYDNTKINDIKVKLTRLNDNKKWEFSKEKFNNHFNVSTANSGKLPFTVIFRPSDKMEYNHGDKFKVIISNIYTLNGKKEQLEFETTFFNLAE